LMILSLHPRSAHKLMTRFTPKPSLSSMLRLHLHPRYFPHCFVHLCIDYRLYQIRNSGQGLARRLLCLRARGRLGEI
jgi:hypothetical protein